MYRSRAPVVTLSPPPVSPPGALSPSATTLVWTRLYTAQKNPLHIIRNSHTALSRSSSDSAENEHKQTAYSRYFGQIPPTEQSRNTHTPTSLPYFFILSVTNCLSLRA